jgi:hypothetical protein
VFYLQTLTGGKMDDEKKCECGMPLDEETECACEASKCIYCCECEDDCTCGCAEKCKKEDEDEEAVE